MGRHFRFRGGTGPGLLLFACAFLTAFVLAPNASAIDVARGGDDEAIAGTYEILSEYGEWVDLEPFGTVWFPNATETWAPFSDGRWEWSVEGWTFVTEEPYADIVYHYGYWYYDAYAGWFWVPGTEWSSARVMWITYMNYVGWAPMPPPGYYWPEPWENWDWDIWTIVGYPDFGDNDIGHHGMGPGAYRKIIDRGDIVRHPPDRKRIEEVTGRAIPVTHIERERMDLRVAEIRTSRHGVWQAVRTRESVTSPREEGYTKRIGPMRGSFNRLPRTPELMRQGRVGGGSTGHVTTPSAGRVAKGEGANAATQTGDWWKRADPTVRLRDREDRSASRHDRDASSSDIGSGSRSSGGGSSGLDNDRAIVGGGSNSNGSSDTRSTVSRGSETRGNSGSDSRPAPPPVEPRREPARPDPPTRDHRGRG